MYIICMYVCMYVHTYVCIFVCVCVCACVFTYVCMFIRVCVCVCNSLALSLSLSLTLTLSHTQASEPIRQQLREAGYRAVKGFEAQVLKSTRHPDFYMVYLPDTADFSEFLFPSGDRQLHF